VKIIAVVSAASASAKKMRRNLTKSGDIIRNSVDGIWCWKD